VLGEPTLQAIARELVVAVRKNVTIDWTLRENVQAQMRVLVRPNSGPPISHTPYRFLAACYAHRRRLADPGELVVKLRSMAAGEDPRVSHWRKPEPELLLSGLRLAMGVSIGCSTTRPWPASRARVIGSRTSAAQGC
jgi:restriction endonuclease HindI-like protein